MSENRIIAVLACLVLTLAPSVTLPDETVTLKTIMQAMRDDLVKITDGLLVDDFELIANGANGIAEHPKIPPEQVKLVAAELAAEMPAFKQLDSQVHSLALAIRSAAIAADRETAYRGYQSMTDGCLTCHAAYKERVARALAADLP